MLKINQLTTGYGKSKILDGLTLACAAGEIHGVLGWNGAGKTTLFNTLFGFLAPWSGVMLLNDQPLVQSDVAFLETEPYFYPNLRGREYLELFSGRRNPAILHWQAIFDLPLEQFVNGYSTGMLKKLAIAGVFLQDRRLMLLDEPFNGLDLESAEKLSWLLEQAKNRDGRIILLSSHILPTLTRLCAQISRLHNGTILRTYAPNDFQGLEQALKSDIHDKLSELTQIKQS